MKWTEAYATGSKQIDDQHKMLFLMCDEFRENLESGTGEGTYDLFLEFLSKYVEIHFAFEEQCMFAHACPAYARNKKEHPVFVTAVEREVAAYRKDGFDRQRIHLLLDMMDRWLDSHIRRVDVQLKSVLS